MPKAKTKLKPPGGAPSRQKKISESLLEQVVALKYEMEEASAITQEAIAKYNRVIAKACHSVKRSIETTTICLDCGLARPREDQYCPKCDKDKIEEQKKAKR